MGQNLEYLVSVRPPALGTATRSWRREGGQGGPQGSAVSTLANKWQSSVTLLVPPVSCEAGKGGEERWVLRYKVCDVVGKAPGIMCTTFILKTQNSST